MKNQIDQNFSDTADILGGIFYLSNSLQTIIDRGMSQRGITVKQWFLLAVLGRMFSSPPKLSDLAECMGTSYQNVKQIALKLEKVGFISLERDENDNRAILVKTTELYNEKFTEGDPEGEIFLANLFGRFSEVEIREFLEYILKLCDGISEVSENKNSKIRERLGR